MTDEQATDAARRLSELYRAVRIRITEQANDNSPFRGFRMEAVDQWPENVIDLCEQAD
jgi:hypothetical protein